MSWSICAALADLRPSIGMTLSAQNRRMLWVPPGFRPWLSDHVRDAEFLYKTTDYWYPEHERTLLWNDPRSASRGRFPVPRY